jgi:gliding motility-associated-like protein
MRNPEDVVQVAFNDTTIAIGSSIQLNVSGNGVSYRWEPPDFLDHPGIQNPIATPTEGVMYTVVVRTASGCIDSKQVTVNVRPEDSFFIPEMFTPDGDGVNDMLFVNTVGYGAIDFKLFNRFGHLVFSTQDSDIGWDGKINGQLQKPDTYVYTLVVEVSEDEFIKEKGTVQLVR